MKYADGHIIIIMMMTQQCECRYLNLTTNSSYILFPAKGIVSDRQIISIRLCICVKRACSLASRAISNTSE